MVMLNEPYPFGNTNGRWGHALLKGLAGRGYDVRCLAVTTHEEWAKGAHDLFRSTGVRLTFYPYHRARAARDTAWFRRKWRSVRQPFSYAFSDGLKRDLDAALGEGYDVLHLDVTWSGYLAAARERALTSVHNLQRLDLARVWHPSGRFLASKFLMGRTEKTLLARLRNIHTTTRRLAGAVSALNRAASVYVVPIALDASLYDFSQEDRTPEPVIGFLANMMWNPGYLAARRLITRIFSKVRARRPDARLLLAGWGARRSLRRYLDVPGVEIVENVPDARPYFTRLQVLAYPLPQGSGMMIKVLEAMAYGIPVVTTTEGIEGYAAEDGRHALIADDDERFAERVAQALDDADLRRRLRRNARRLAEEHHSPQSTAAAFERVYQCL